MVTIYNITNGETYKMNQGVKDTADTDSVCTSAKVGNKFRHDWKCIVDYFIELGSCHQLLLGDNFRIKGVDKQEEKKFQEIFGWAW